MSSFVQVIKNAIPDLPESGLSSGFEELSIDSFDLLNIRVEIERVLGQEIPDSVWTEFRRFDDVLAYCDERGPQAKERTNEAQILENRYTRTFELNMPHMAIESMSESWLFKEIGAAHWELLCRGLGQKSSALTDELGNRLYATFARVRHQSEADLSAFVEAEQVAIEGEIHRFGSGMYVSEFTLSSQDEPAKSIRLSMITSFSRRGETGNKNLVKSRPHVEQNLIPDLASSPEFIDEYRGVKKQEVSQITLGGATLPVSDAILAEEIYELNPYHDLNGVGLLYFAAYPIIAETCEARIFNREPNEGHHEIRWASAARDVLYYGNCDITDRVIYRLHENRVDDGRLLTVASLSRESDDALMAQVFAVKARRA